MALTPELERYTRSVCKKLNLTFDILTDLHLKTAERFRLVFALPDYMRDLYKSCGHRRLDFVVKFFNLFNHPNRAFSAATHL